MEIVLEIPDDIALCLQTPRGTPDSLETASVQQLSRDALEAFALQAYKEYRLNAPQLRRLLGFTTRYQLDGFLKLHEVWLEYSAKDIQRDVETHRKLGIGL